MREIEFRGKLKGNSGTWIFGSLVISEKSEQNLEGENYAIFPKEKVLPYADVIPETVGQYTGLKDKNDVKIFHNDIVLFNNKDIAVICWFKNSWRLNFPWEFASIGNAGDDTIEVIGNIYDNPELLEVGA